ncbi:vitelline membrane outer layer protein 1 homolog [Passerculus sandwichensis]
MALSPRPRLALVALVALVAPLGTLVASQRRMCHLRHPLSWGGPGHGVMAVTNGGPWGQWGDSEFCPPGSFAIGVQLKVQPYQGFFSDDTGLNGVRLLCDTGTDTVTSSVGLFGSWQQETLCEPGERLVSFRLMVEAPRGLWDDAAATNLAVLCSGDVVLRPGAELARGPWGALSARCDAPCGVCGLRTRLDADDSSDATGLNDVRLYCCAP